MPINLFLCRSVVMFGPFGPNVASHEKDGICYPLLGLAPEIPLASTLLAQPLRRQN